MPIAGAIVEVQKGSGGAVVRSLARIDTVSIFGVKDNRIVAVIEDTGMPGMAETIAKIQAIEQVVGVYPVYAGGYDDA